MTGKKLSVIVLLLLICSALGEAVSVERTAITPRQPGVFLGNVRSARNTKTGLTLLVYQKQSGENQTLWGLLLGADGKQSGASFPIVATSWAGFPDVAYNSAANQFLLVYMRRIPGSTRFEIRSQRLSATGRRSGPFKILSAALEQGTSATNFLPHVVFDSANSTYVVSWLHAVSTPAASRPQGLLGAVVDSKGLVAAGPAVMTSLQGEFAGVRGPFVTDVAYDSKSGKLMMVGYTVSTEPGFSFQYFVARADATLQNPAVILRPLKPGLSTGAAPFASLLFAPGGGMHTLFVENSGVRRRRINNLGAPIGAPTLFFTGSIQNVPLEFPVAAMYSSAGTSETQVVALDDSSAGTARLWLQEAGSSGAAIGSPFELQSNFDATQRSVIIPISEGGAFHFAIIYIEGTQIFPPDPNRSSGLILLRVNTGS